MKFETLTKEEAKNYFDLLSNNKSIPSNYFEKLSKDYMKIRHDLYSFYVEVENDCYMTDLNFAIKIYEYFLKIDGFNDNIASNYDFWRYICIRVIPDVIHKRHGWVPAYFYEKNVRMYVPTMWWYIHMCLQDSIESTYEALKNFNTDYIMQLVERPGREGMYLDISREIIKTLSNLPTTKQKEKINGVYLYRRVLI